MRGLGDTISEVMVVGKVLRNMGPKYNHVVATIKESKDLTKLSLDELSGSLQAHESRLISHVEKVEEKSFHVKGEASLTRKAEKFPDRSQTKGPLRGRFRG